ncbi:MAG TPA: urease subunit alpha [Candidatus Limnocylindrales bacterium]
MGKRPVGGPLAGESFRVADTDLWLTVDENRQAVGDEPLLSYGGTIRTFSQGKPGPSELDMVLVGPVVVDPVVGVIKADIGIKDGRVVSIGGVGRDMEIGPHTEPITCYGLVATPGVVDSHVHFVTPDIVPVALSAGVTTLITAGFDEPPYAMERFIRSFEEWPINIGLQANARDTDPGSLDVLLGGGAVGFKMHEDYGADAELIDTTLAYADAHDVSVALHTDGLNEAVEVDDTVAAINGRTIHAYHVEGTGGGHVPDVISLVREANIICSSTTPTIPYGVNAVAEHLPMTSISHGLSLDDPDQAHMTRERIRATTMAAEGPLHELGAIQITNSDSQGMGRIGEVLRRTLQLAQVMKPDPGAEHDNQRFLRYLAKCTIEPAITHGLSEHVGSLQPGMLADIVLWKPAWFGVKPEVVFKSGFPSWGSYGDGNATLEWSEPRRFRAGWGGKGLAPASVSVTFISGVLDAQKFARTLGSRRAFIGVKRTRGLTRADLHMNKSTAPVDVDPVDGTVTLDGSVLAVAPASELRLNRSHFLA